MNHYPYAINSGHGEEITFLKLVTTNDPYIELYSRVEPGCGPAMHVHHLQEETLNVVKGKMGVKVKGQPVVYYMPGEGATFKRGTPHKFWAEGTEILEISGFASPPNNMEYFLKQIYASMRNNKKARPGVFDSAFLLSKYRSEFDMTDLPKFIKKVFFPVVLFIGRISGKYKKYADAPPPVTKP